MVLICHDNVSLSRKDLMRFQQEKLLPCRRSRGGFKVLWKRRVVQDLELSFGRCFIICRPADRKDWVHADHQLDPSRRALAVHLLTNALLRNERKRIIKEIRRGY
jgi:hypothetical protein